MLSKMAQTRLILAVVLVTLLLFVGGFLIGYFTTPGKSSDSDNDDAQTSETSRFEAHDKLYELLNAERIRDYLR